MVGDDPKWTTSGDPTESLAHIARAGGRVEISKAEGFEQSGVLGHYGAMPIELTATPDETQEDGDEVVHIWRRDEFTVRYFPPSDAHPADQVSAERREETE